MGLALVEEAALDLSAFGVTTGPQLQASQRRLDALAAELVSESIALVDAWQFTDAQLGHSAIGSADGKRTTVEDSYIWRSIFY